MSSLSRDIRVVGEDFGGRVGFVCVWQEREMAAEGRKVCTVCTVC